MIDWFLILIALVWIVTASIWDLKKREVPNWLNFSLIVFALSYRAIYSVYFWDASSFVYGVIGFGIFFGLANAFYYGRLFAGGDAKLLMGLGAVLPVYSAISLNAMILGMFILLLLFAGSFYGLVYSFGLVVINWKNFAKEFPKQMKSRKRYFIFGAILTLSSLLMIFYLRDFSLFAFTLIFILFPFLFVYARTIEESCMICVLHPSKLTIGDWLYEEVKVGKRKIKPYWEGLSEDEIGLLRKYNKKVKVKNGIPFVPAFLIAYVILLFGVYFGLEYFMFWI